VRTTVDIDEDVVESLREETGIRTKKETIDCALRYLLDRVQHGELVVDTPKTTGRVFCLSAGKASALKKAMEIPAPSGEISARLIL